MNARPLPYLVKKNSVVTHFALHSPDDVLPGVHSKYDLQHALDFYGHPFVHGRLPEGKHAQRWYVTRVRPALRWFCNKYDVHVPKWLKENGIYDLMTEEERIEHYGRPDLEVKEFDDEDAPPPTEDDADENRQSADEHMPKKPKKTDAKTKPKKKEPK